MVRSDFFETGCDAVVAGHVQLYRLEGRFEMPELGNGVFCCRQVSRRHENKAILESFSDTLSDTEADASVGSGDQDDFRHWEEKIKRT